MEVTETRNCLVTDILLNTKKNGRIHSKTVKPNCLTGGVVKRAYFQTKWNIPLTKNYAWKLHQHFNNNNNNKSIVIWLGTMINHNKTTTGYDLRNTNSQE